eukprot:9482950-Pyramimonas_sp.AAC.2
MGGRKHHERRIRSARRVRHHPGKGAHWRRARLGIRADKSWTSSDFRLDRCVNVRWQPPLSGGK